MALISTLVDNFSSYNAANWGINYVSGGTAVITSNDSANNGMYSVSTAYDITDSSLSWQLVSISMSANASNSARIGIRDYGNGTNLKFIVTGNTTTIIAESMTITGVTYSAGMWMRIRHSTSAGLFYLETSIDGTTWVINGSATPATIGVINLSTIHVEFDTYSTNVGSHTTITLDNVNIPPAGPATLTGISQLTGVQSITL